MCGEHCGRGTYGGLRWRHGCLAGCVYEAQLVYAIVGIGLLHGFCALRMHTNSP